MPQTVRSAICGLLTALTAWSKGARPLYGARRYWPFGFVRGFAGEICLKDTAHTELLPCFRGPLSPHSSLFKVVFVYAYAILHAANVSMTPEVCRLNYAGAISMTLYYTAIFNMPLADAVRICFIL